MVEVLQASTEQCVVVKFGGRISGEEYKTFLEAVDGRLKVRERISMVADLSEFEFYGDFESFKEDFHFGTHEYRKIERAAFVGNRKWIDLFLKLSGPFYKAEEKHFVSGELDDAIAWACAAS
ncbi:MAG: SpoIIAA family protein [Candidatus Geothermincolia bacterium]